MSNATESQPLSAAVLEGDSLRVLKAVPDCSMDAVVTDPPYAIARTYDVTSQFQDVTARGSDPCTVCDEETCNRGFTACSRCIEALQVDAFERADMLGQQSANWHEKATHSRGYADNDPHQLQEWVRLWAKECLRVLKPGGHMVAFGGTRTWHRLAAGVEDAGFEVRDSLAWLYGTGFPKSVDVEEAVWKEVRRAGPEVDLPTGVSAAFRGWETALKPGHEPIVLARKPLVGTVARTALAHGTGGLNVGACLGEDGRWPSNLLLDQSQQVRGHARTWWC